MTEHLSPVDAPVILYCAEEVWRQGHDVTRRDGIERVGWMLQAWAHATSLLIGGLCRPRVEDVIALGKMVEPTKNKHGLRKGGVRVGSATPPIAKDVPELLEAWVRALPLPNPDPLASYRVFEEIHPFVDGNGRVGKILLNWLNQSLYTPMFPPAHFWGREIRNPWRAFSCMTR